VGGAACHTQCAGAVTRQEVTIWRRLGSGSFGTVYAGNWVGLQVRLKT
jgi:hypothetical protein